MLDVRFSPQGPLRSDGASLDPWVPRALAGEVRLPFGHGVLVVTDGSVLLLDQLGPRLGG
jgi:hypothetical protein